ncbi:uncharacterized protein LOC111240910 [Vigna radiata var. radiata]|uniref:Uncharacterized protein LOC111240910 n=1 Tax=Vigna radiata var. radiata TaxID=3916 RepID=A0A3Q0ER46_VIGRR|nr:uncharacterized protein LOC111240910 [Vigna radiata var. radiata]
MHAMRLSFLYYLRHNINLLQKQNDPNNPHNFFYNFHSQKPSSQINFCFFILSTPRTRVLFEDLYCQMGKSKNEEYENKEKEGIKKSHYFMVFISSLLISITGGSLLGWWLHKYHPTNKQLWMVPFGLILLFTPFIVCLSVIISGPAIHKNDEEDVLNINQRIQPLDRLF